MDLQMTVSLFALLAVAVLYAAFDLFNKRNVPDVFAYLSVIVGVIITFAFNQADLLYSLAIALTVGVIGYVIYRMGLWGAGDYFELVAISLIFPIQPLPILANVAQLDLPFILSVFIATGVAAIWIVPIFYLVFVKKSWRKMPDEKHVIYGVSLFLLYMILLFFVYYFYGSTLGRVALIMVVAVPSAITLVFEEEITSRMVENIYPRQLDEGDIIAFNMMSISEIKRFSKYKGFGRLATKKLIARMRNSREKLPVYRNAAPLAVFILIGIIISLLFGNVVLFLV
jgi:hypothetical protein